MTYVSLNEILKPMTCYNCKHRDLPMTEQTATDLMLICRNCGAMILKYYNTILEEEKEVDDVRRGFRKVMKI